MAFFTLILGRDKDYQGGNIFVAPQNDSCVSSVVLEDNHPQCKENQIKVTFETLMCGARIHKVETLQEIA